ncbi:hypothetical protein GALMADRAFT_144277 [Galerina marginata CBS 339.88]|uniref:Uncharacterized protein n=1 Tax=Galerina marginata (strain CBS 339.88) TaxID=685588 RepID=A0A067SL71_GALM3|nr:hypothetical protein GALMADRAFT_144277 [Galerina marginata CBS 339.88]
MFWTTLATCTVLGLQMLRAFAGPVDSSTTDVDELVMTPGGLIPKSNIHAVPYGATVHHTPSQVQIIGTDGAILHTAQISNGVKKINIAPTAPGTAPRALQSGYIAFANWRNTAASQITSFTTVWPVPSTPTSWNGQLLYWFNGLVPDSFDAILQPVLQYGVSPAGGGEYYSIASWFVVGSNAYHSSLTRVSVGQQLTGVMTLNSISSTYNWNSIFTGVSASSLSISTAEVLDWAYEALEIYTTSIPSNLPAGHTAMTGINIANGATHPASIPWSPSSDPGDSVFMSITSTSSTSGAVQITYPQ